MLKLRIEREEHRFGWCYRIKIMDQNLQEAISSLPNWFPSYQSATFWLASNFKPGTFMMVD